VLVTGVGIRDTRNDFLLLLLPLFCRFWQHLCHREAAFAL
jgi:hypothetical protein